MKDGTPGRFAVRPAKNLDASFIQNTVGEVLKEYGLKFDQNGKDSDLNDIEENYFDSDGFFGIVNDNETDLQVGTFGIFRLSSEVCELRKMYLIKDARGRGCGRMVLDFAVAWARKKNYKKIRLETMGVLREAIALYVKYGFSEIRPAKVNDRVDQAFELTL